MPPLRVPRLNIAITFGMEELEWFGYPTVKTFECTVTRFDRMYVRDRQTDGRASHDGLGRACIALHGKNCL